MSVEQPSGGSISERATRPQAIAEVFSELHDAVAPAFFAMLVFLSGGAMLALSAAPGWFEGRRVSRIVEPLVVFEASHFVSSIVGTLMLFVAAGLWQRLNSAWLLSILLMAAGAVASLLTGAHYLHAMALIAIMTGLIASRRAFYRQTGLGELDVSPTWPLAILAVIAGATWLGFFSFRHVEYRDELWWTFERNAATSRFLRGEVAVAFIVMLVAWLRLMRARALPKREERTAEFDARIESVIAEADFSGPDANLAFLDDKRFMFSPSGRSFIMYGVSGRSWIAMGPPVGRREEVQSLSWRFRDLADRSHANAVFYAIDADFLPVALDLGLTVQKIGENAVVDLEKFTLEGGKRSRLRQARRGIEKAGCAFKILERDEVGARMDELAAVSNAWLAAHKGAEKCFSLGRFEPRYVARFRVGAILKDGKVVAFANIMTAEGARAASVDLMRHSPDAPQGIMDGLFVELIMWAKERGYRVFDLGMAPLAGLERRRLAPMLSRIGVLVYEHGGGLYGFEGLRKYKEKFDPLWKPVYLAAPNRLDAAMALGGVALLTSGGVRGIFSGPRG